MRLAFFQSVQIDLEPFYNNKAFGTYPGEAAFDALNQSYPSPNLGKPYYTSKETGIVYSFPGYTGPDKPDNVICSGQTIPVPPGSYFSASFLVAADVDQATVAAGVIFTYEDESSTSAYELRALNFYEYLTINRGELVFPSRFTGNGSNFNTSHIFERTSALSVGKKLASITLPTTTNATAGRQHVFAISLWQGASLGVQSVRPTQKWLEDGAQVVDVTVNNAGSECVSGGERMLSLEGPGFQTTSLGRLKRLCPGDQKVVTLGVQGSSNGSISVEVVIDDDKGQERVPFKDVSIGLTEWTQDLDSLARHESPDWFNDGKFGWGNSSPYESYAEWFWWYSTHHPEADKSDFYNYRLRTYGPDWVYDDTFPDFNGSKFDPKMWVDLFAEAGAKYFVFTSKHHDGFALFDSGAVSNRTSLHYGPKRDLLGELFEAAETYQPALKRGTYFSLPEWFNPAWEKYGFTQFDKPSSTSWTGGLATNPYTGEKEPYTGYVPVDDFVTDLMLPQMETLAYKYGTDIMWCDTGAANATAEFAARWWNTARQQGRQVAINSRCGVAQAADFDTPEYETFASAQKRKWESNRGMDPYSYGYNRATPAGAYMNASAIVRTLVDMVAKNGNLLLDIGPRADGSLVQAEVDHLREAGRWIRGHGEALFNTTYWFVQSEVAGGGPGVRFTQTESAFYILFLERPVVTEEGVVKVLAPVPILPGDRVSLLTVEGGESLAWSVSGEGSDAQLSIAVEEDLLDRGEFSWVFKVAYA
ncbi:glycoside hydrolase family 29 protein [Apiospora marii]|uniref:glycoside hydrolase family 29 protein n=1 Tax=Apiospora marii TaxID=335849 RepID=UPI00312EBC66